MRKVYGLAGLLLWAGTLWAQSAIAPTGSGESNDPYRVRTWQNLYWISQNPAAWDKHFRQMEDITLPDSGADDIKLWDNGSGWFPIGGTGGSPGGSAFTGRYYGNDFKITGLYVNRPQMNNVGLFGVSTSAMIVDLGLVDVDITGGNDVGALVGTFSNGSIDHCASNGSVRGNRNVGGLAGNISGGEVVFSQSRGSVTGTMWIGGLVGHFANNTTSRYNFSSANVSGETVVGGLIANNYGNIQACYSTGNVTGTNNRVGGLIGNTTVGGAISDSYSRGRVIGTGAVDVGGLIGRFNGGTLSNSYSTGEVVGDSSAQGLTYGNASTCTNCFWDVETSGIRLPGAGSGKTSQEMKQQSTYSSWNFSSLWEIDAGINDGYPYIGIMNFRLGQTVKAEKFDLGSQNGRPFIRLTGNQVHIHVSETSSLKNGAIRLRVYNTRGAIIESRLIHTSGTIGDVVIDLTTPVKGIGYLTLDVDGRVVGRSLFR